MLKAQAVGRLPREVDLRYTSNGRAVSNFSLMCKVGIDGQGNDITSVINCVLWNKPAETIANYTTTGSLLSVEGDIHTSKYENKEGQTVYTTVLTVNHFEFLETNETTKQRREKNQTMSQQSSQENNSITYP